MGWLIHTRWGENKQSQLQNVQWARVQLKGVVMPRGRKQLQLQWKSTENLQCAIVQRYGLGGYVLSAPKKYKQLKGVTIKIVIENVR